VKELNTNQIGPLDKLVQEKNNDLIRTNAIEFFTYCCSAKNVNDSCFKSFKAPLKDLFTIMGKKNISTRDTSWITMQIQGIHKLIEKVNTDKGTRTDIQNFEAVLNIQKAISQKADLIYGNSWAGILGTVQLKGLFLFFIVLVFLLTAWFHAHLANLSEQCLTAKARYKDANANNADLKLTTREEIQKILEKPTFSEIRTIKIFISIIILLIIPIFKPVTKEKIRLDKPLWQFTLPNLILGDKNPIIVKPEETINFSPVDNKRVEYAMDTGFINNALTKHDSNIIKMVDISIKASEESIYNKLKGKSKK
jgi:hypothetical protein